MDTLSITGSWEGAMLSDQDGEAMSFSLLQPPHALTSPRSPQLRIGDTGAAPARLLEATARMCVMLVDEARDPASGRLAQLLMDARVLGDRLVGHWLRRDDEGHLLGSGQLEASRVGNR